MMLALFCWTLFWLRGTTALSARLGNRVGTDVVAAIIEEESRKEQGYPQDMQRGRDLVWMEQTSRCSEQIENWLKSTHPTTTFCFETNIVWDEGGVFTAKKIRHGFKTTYYYGFSNPATIAHTVTNFTAFYNGAQCQHFLPCVFIVGENTVELPGQYEYDCSNVYCGPNAARSCSSNFTYRDTECPSKETSLPTIPSLRNVNCEIFSSLLAVADTGVVCGACEEDVDNSLVFIKCEPQCLGCDENNCMGQITEHFFSESSRTDSVCRLHGQQLVCINRESPAKFQAYADPILFSCVAFFITSDAGKTCASCSICGVNPNGQNAHNGKYAWTDILYQGDCTNLDNISTFNECDRTFTGVFEMYYADLDPAPCQDYQAASFAIVNETQSPAVTVPPAPALPAVSIPMPAPVAVGVPVATAPATGTVAAPLVTAPATTVGQAAETLPSSSTGKANVSLCTVFMALVGCFG